MVKAARARAGGWWRFDAYEVRTGRPGRADAVGPAPGARLTTYDPWSLAAGPSAPHTELSALVCSLTQPLPPDWEALRRRRAGEGSDAPREPLPWEIPEDTAKVAAWCARFGLLGLMPHQLRVVRFPREPGALGSGHADVTRQYAWAGEGWLDTWTASPRGSAISAPEGVLCGFSGTWNTAPPTSWWSKYRTDAGSRWPAPGTAEFWEGYEEPLDEFIQVAQHIAHIAAALSNCRGGEVDDPDGFRAEFRRDLNALLAPVRPALAATGERMAQLWLSPSLLGSIATMVALDLAHAQLVACEVCSRVVRSTRDDRKYCGPVCKRAFEARRLRARRRAARPPAR
jgi:hypothetical protein